MFPLFRTGNRGERSRNSRLSAWLLLYLDATSDYAFTATVVPEPASAILLAGGLGIVFAAAPLARGRLAGGRR